MEDLMKLGSIVGLIIAAILIIAGITLCIIGTVSASGEGRELFMQIDDSGTHYTQDISKDVTKLAIEFSAADITINGGAEKSYIEFTNFNPNRYSVSASANVITFNETADISSILDLGNFGFSFKGLRYFLDPRNDDFDEMEKSIVINISADSSLKIIDIDAENSNVTVDGVSVSGDLLLNIKNGSVTVKESEAKSAISVTGDSLKTTLEESNAKVFRYNVKNSELLMNGCTFGNTDISLESGRVDFISNVTIDDKSISVTSESGGILFNTKPASSPFTHEPALSDDGKDTAVSTFKIKCVSASVNLNFPSEIVISGASQSTTSAKK